MLLKCNYSFYLFSKKNPIRLFCWSLIKSDYFEAIVISLICLASLKLAIETYFLINPIQLATDIFYYADLFFTISFTLEFLLKSIGYGFLFDEGSYLRDSWCQLDFFIVVASIIDISIPNVNIPMIKVLRLFRIFRPLRFVTHNVNMRIIVTALFRSFGAICNTLAMVACYLADVFNCWSKFLCRKISILYSRLLCLLNKRCIVFLMEESGEHMITTLIIQ